MNKLIAAIEALPDTSNVEAYPANYDSDEVLASFAVFDEMPTLVNAVNEHETLTAKIEALEDKLAVAERLINEINDARAARRWAQATADAWDETVRLLQRRGYGKADYVPGKALYYPSEVAK